MGSSIVCSNDELLDVLIDYSRKIYGDSKCVGLDDLKDPKAKAQRLWDILNPNEEISAAKDQDDLDQLLMKLKDKLSDRAARVYTEKLINQQILHKMEENEKEYLNQIKLQVIKKHSDNENASTLKRYAELEKKKRVFLTKQISDILRPQEEDEIIGQSKGVKALISKIASPYF